MNHVIAISINNYHPKFGNIALQMCHYDASRFAVLLPTQDYIYTFIRDENATGNEIIGQICTIASEVKAGDTVYIYFSGHGTYYDTTRGRKTGRVAYDRVVWDDEMLKAIRTFPKGVLLCVISDCCFAESNSRNAAIPGLYAKAVQTKEVPVKPYAISRPNLKCAAFFLSACSILETAKELRNSALGLDKGGVFTTALVMHLKANPKANFKTIEADIRKIVPREMEQTFELEYVNARNLRLQTIIANGQ